LRNNFPSEAKLDIVVRKFRKEDINKIRRLAEASFSTESDRYWSVVDALRAPKTLVAEIKNQIVGVIEFEAYRLPRSIEGHIWYIFVHPEHHGRGIGTKLLRSAEIIMISEGAWRFWALTGADNIKTQQFFEKNGYKRITVDEMKSLLGSRNTKRLLRRMVYWEGDIIYVKSVNKKEKMTS